MVIEYPSNKKRGPGPMPETRDGEQYETHTVLSIERIAMAKSDEEVLEILEQ